MLNLLLTIVGSFLYAELLGHVVHRLAHVSYSGGLNRSHMNHHQMYRVEDFLDSSYRSAGADSFGRKFVVPAAVSVVAAFSLLPLHLFLVAAAVFALVGVANEAVHRSIHVRGAWLERFMWFRKLRNIHVVHHRNMRANFGIVFFLYDRIFETFSEPQDRDTAS